MTVLAVIWHDIECGPYVEDLPLWRELAAGAGGPILDVGAGTGRTALALAADGIDVTALDDDAALLGALDARAADAGLTVATVCADARAFALGRRFALIVVPMQTIQLLGGREGRAAFLRCAQAHLQPGGLICAALADALEAFDADTDLLPVPDRAEHDGVVYLSRPLAIVDEGACAAIHRLREIPGSPDASTLDVIRLDRLEAAELAEEAEALGLTAETARRIPSTDQYVGSTVVMLHG
jgi:SAM-dependent methyltransferase